MCIVGSSDSDMSRSPSDKTRCQIAGGSRSAVLTQNVHGQDYINAAGELVITEDQVQDLPLANVSSYVGAIPASWFRLARRVIVSSLGVSTNMRSSNSRAADTHGSRRN